MKRNWLVLCAALFLAVVTFGQEKRPLPIAVKVEAEGSGKGQGMWIQAASDLTSQQTKALKTLVVDKIRTQGQGDIKIVSLDYQDDFVGVTVVAARLGGGTGKWYYVASSAVIVAKKKGVDELVTHDVLADSSLENLARAIAYQFATVRLRAATGLWK